MATNNQISGEEPLLDELRDERLPQVCEVVEQEDVVMYPDGSLQYTSGGKKKSLLRKKRKELVLGINGFEEHSLSEANEIISSQRDSHLSRIRDFFSHRKV